MIPSGKVAIVSHDSGGAEILSSLLNQISDSYILCLDGPAIKIFKRKSIPIQNFNLEEAIESADWVLTGTSWESNLEYKAICLAKDKGKFVVSFLDHWVNYKERFIRNGREVLPDKILVSDRFANNKACINFPTTPIIQLPNLYLQLESKCVYSSRVRECRTPFENILIITEPIKEKIIGNDSSLELIAIEYFMSNLNKINLSNKKVEMHLRPHPSEPSDKYNFLRVQYPTVEINISKSNKLYEDIAWADLVVGMNSFALTVALSSKVPTMSILPPESKDCVLPYKEIFHLRNM